MSATVSVIIPAFNAEDVIGDAIATVAKQTYRDTEIIVVDDGSTDATAEIAAASKLATVVTQENTGASAARNNGVKHARGRYVAFLDADDLWHPQKLALQMVVAPSVPQLITCGGYSVAIEQHRISAPWPIAVDLEAAARQRSLHEVFANPYVPTGSYLLPRALFQELGGFDTRLPTAEDIDLLYRAARHCGGSVHFDSRLVLIRYSLTSLGMSLRSYDDNRRVIDDFLSSFPSPDPELEKIAAQLHRRILNNYSGELYARGEWRGSLRTAAESLRYGWERRSLMAFLRRLLPPILSPGSRKFRDR